MSTRKSTSIGLFITSLALAAMAHAGEFSMAGGDLATEAVASTSGSASTAMEPVSRASAGGDTLGYASASVSTSNDDAPAARPVVEAEASAPAAAPARVAAPATTPAASSRTRSGNRWQSLVPGAIK